MADESKPAEQPMVRLEHKDGHAYDIPADQAQAALDTGDFTHTKQEFSPLESVAKGAAQGATLGFGDEASAGVGALLQHLLTKDPESFKALYTRYRDDERRSNAESARQNPGSALVGQIAGSLPAAIATGGLGAPAGAGTAAKIASGVGQGALLGGAQGLGDANELDAEGLTHAAKTAAMGGAIGGALPAIGAGLKAAAPTLAKAGLNIKTPEVKLLGGPDAVEPAMKEALATPEISGGLKGLNMTAHNVAERTDARLADLGGQLEGLYSQLDQTVPYSPISKKGLMRAVLNATAEDVEDRGLQAAQTRALHVIDKASAGNSLTFAEAQRTMNRLKQLGAFVKGIPDTHETLTARNAVWEPAWREINDIMQKHADNVLAKLTPKDAPFQLGDLQAIRAAYGSAARLHNAASSAAARNAGHNIAGMGEMLGSAAGAAAAGPIGAAKGFAATKALRSIGTPAAAKLADVGGNIANTIPGPIAAAPAASLGAPLPVPGQVPPLGPPAPKVPPAQPAPPAPGAEPMVAENPEELPQVMPSQPTTAPMPVRPAEGAQKLGETHRMLLQKYGKLFSGKSDEQKAQLDFKLQETDPLYREMIKRAKKEKDK